MLLWSIVEFAKPLAVNSSGIMTASLLQLKFKAISKAGIFPKLAGI